MLMRQKRDKSWRICGDYRRLNRMTLPDRYPVPHLRDFTHKLNNCTIFTTLDLERAYFNIPMAEEDRKKTALITPFGLYEFNVMPFGLKNAAQSFQRFMDTVLRGLEFCFVFLDDILIASKTPEEHREHFEIILSRLQDHGLSIKTNKCFFGKPEVEYLGYLVTSKGIKALKHRVRAILNYPKPANISQLRRFFGILNFYRLSIPKAARIQAPLHALTAGAKKNVTRDKYSGQQKRTKLLINANSSLLKPPC